MFGFRRKKQWVLGSNDWGERTREEQIGPVIVRAGQFNPSDPPYIEIKSAVDSRRMSPEHQASILAILEAVGRRIKEYEIQERIHSQRESDKPYKDGVGLVDADVMGHLDVRILRKGTNQSESLRHLTYAQLESKIEEDPEIVLLDVSQRFFMPALANKDIYISQEKRIEFLRSDRKFIDGIFNLVKEMAAQPLATDKDSEASEETAGTQWQENIAKDLRKKLHVMLAALAKDGSITINGDGKAVLDRAVAAFQGKQPEKPNRP